ncbi:hypothetical protein GF373_12580 [bacterium]|nr:hypothetical protein [bacterium]
MTHWDSLYQNAYQRGLQKIQALDGIACAFHSVIDGIIRLTPEILDRVFASKPELIEAAKAGHNGTLPEEILTPADFICGLFYSLQKGRALQRMIRSKETYEWALETFGSGELRLGGTSANMARSLVPLGIPTIIYANPLTTDLANLFGEFENLKVITKAGDGFALQTPQEAAREDGVFAIHWILEYTAEFTYDLDGTRVQPGRANRYIPSWNPRNNQFRMDPDFREGFFTLTDSINYLLFSGFHILSEAYPDGSTCEDVIRPLSDFLQQVRRDAPHIKIHLEMACIGSATVRQAMLDHIFPYIHSAGMNETELPLLCDTLRHDCDFPSIPDDPGILDYTASIAHLMDSTGLNRVHFHNLGYYLCIEKEPWETREDTRDALLFAAIMAASRAKNGPFSSIDDIQIGLQQHYDEKGLKMVEALANEMNQPSLAQTGIGNYGEYSFVLIPSKFVQDPIFTVGLGDTISSGALLTE